MQGAYATLGICHSVWMTVWYAGCLCDTWNLSLCVEDYLVCIRIDTVVPPDDGHTVARNMYRKEINILRKICAPSWLYLQDIEIEPEQRITLHSLN